LPGAKSFRTLAIDWPVTTAVLAPNRHQIRHFPAISLSLRNKFSLVDEFANPVLSCAPDSKHPINIGFSAKQQAI